MVLVETDHDGRLAGDLVDRHIGGAVNSEQRLLDLGAQASKLLEHLTVEAAADLLHRSQLLCLDLLEGDE